MIINQVCTGEAAHRMAVAMAAGMMEFGAPTCWLISTRDLPWRTALAGMRVLRVVKKEQK